jgi:SAGA-associated factor 73
MHKFKFLQNKFKTRPGQKKEIRPRYLIPINKSNRIESVASDTIQQKKPKRDSSKKEKKKKAAPKPKRDAPQINLIIVPVDVERQCGVIDPEKGTMCARSLTCKSHSMSSKRAVPGRSQPYDILLSQWQRKNQVKIAATQKTVEKEVDDVDSEEEVKLVMQGVLNRYAKPMDQKCVVGVRRKIRGMRMYEGLRVALLGAVHGMPGSGVGRGRRQSQVSET